MKRIALLAFVVVACSDASGKDIRVRPAKVVPGTTPYTGDQNYFLDDRAAADPANAQIKPGEKDGAKGDKQDGEWVPNEFKAGMARWKDTGVYLDGKPIAFMSWGELPVSLKPVWVKDKISTNKRPGTNDLGWRWARQRFYRFTDYLKTLGVDIRKVKELHVYGPKFTQTIIATGADLQSPEAQGFMFRFGGNVYGKAIPQVPDEFGNGKTPDKISSVMIYIEKKPPDLVPHEGLFLDGVEQIGVPYFGDPIRGGVRIYLDARLAAIIKRQELDPKQATKSADGELEWKLSDVLAAQGVVTDKVVEVWVIRDEKRQDKLPGSELATLTFQAGAQAKGGVLLGGKLRANAIHLSTRAIKDDEIPRATIDDD
jgi:hypothetical protein